MDKYRNIRIKLLEAQSALYDLLEEVEIAETKSFEDHKYIDDCFVDAYEHVEYLPSFDDFVFDFSSFANTLYNALDK